MIGYVPIFSEVSGAGCGTRQPCRPTEDAMIGARD
jgi:hypothetical protein